MLGASALSVVLTNDGTSLTSNLTLGDKQLPATFSISAPDRTGDLAIAINATDVTGLLVGQGQAVAQVGQDTVHLTLDTADFVVNSDSPGDQFPTDDPEASGFQLAALPNGTWTAAFRDGCPTGDCTIFARRFDELGRPVASAAAGAASTTDFALTSAPADTFSAPAISADTTTTLALWDVFDDAGTTSIACRTLDPTGAASTAQVDIAPDNADVVDLAALPNGNFITSWTNLDDETIRSIVVTPDCGTIGTVQTVSTVANTANRASVAVNGPTVLFTWIVDGSVHIRLANTDGTPASSDLTIISSTPTDAIVHARAAPATGGGFVLAVRRADTASTSTGGRLELYRLTALGALIGQTLLITDQSANDAADSESFAIASANGMVLVAWHTCGALGDGDGCGVFGEFIRDNGEPATSAFVLPTTTKADQIRPSVVALRDSFVAIWSDASAQAPDTSGLAVRARILYPPTELAAVAR